ncbi:hypothetical protein CR513_20179, partial [Mucuna pruriens]
MDSETCRYIRKLRPIPTKALDLHALRHWESYLKGQWRRTFEGRHGNLLGLLSIEAQPATLSALIQYYDPPLRCFTFMDFQLVPTVEEHERLVDVRARSAEKKEKSKRAGKPPKGQPRRETPTALERRGLIGFHGRLWAPSLRHNALPPDKGLYRLGGCRRFPRQKGSRRPSLEEDGLLDRRPPECVSSLIGPLWQTSASQSQTCISSIERNANAAPCTTRNGRMRARKWSK